MKRKPTARLRYYNFLLNNINYNITRASYCIYVELYIDVMLLLVGVHWEGTENFSVTRVYGVYYHSSVFVSNDIFGHGAIGRGSLALFAVRNVIATRVNVISGIS